MPKHSEYDGVVLRYNGEAQLDCTQRAANVVELLDNLLDCRTFCWIFVRHCINELSHEIKTIVVLYYLVSPAKSGR